MLSASNVSNAPGWLDLVSPDMVASVSFYQAVFGWTAAHEADDPSVECLMVRNGGKAVAGLDPLTESGGRPAGNAQVVDGRLHRRGRVRVLGARDIDHGCLQQRRRAAEGGPPHCDRDQQDRGQVPERTDRKQRRRDQGQHA
jgi:hypothetical protein